jgi:hypothetical protein
LPAVAARPLRLHQPALRSLRRQADAELDRSILNYRFFVNGALSCCPSLSASMAIIPLQIKMFMAYRPVGASLDQGISSIAAAV